MTQKEIAKLRQAQMQNILVYDAQAKPGQLTQRLLDLALRVVNDPKTETRGLFPECPPNTRILSTVYVHNSFVYRKLPESVQSVMKPMRKLDKKYNEMRGGIARGDKYPVLFEFSDGVLLMGSF